MDIEKEYIPDTADKSHIITMGERLYTESIEFIREIVNDAYDSDATLFEITLTEDSIEIKDNGTGMDREGPFGIGKFASLSACDRFEGMTKKGDFVGRVTFDKKEYGSAGDVWSLPLEAPPAAFRKIDGATVLNERMNRRFELTDIAAKIIGGTPLKAPNLQVKLNNHAMTPRSLPGQKIPSRGGTEFGPVHGEIIILPRTPASANGLGIAIKAKQVTLRGHFRGWKQGGLGT